MLCRILKTRIKHQYFTRGKSFESGTRLAASCAHELRYQTAKSLCIFFGRAKIRRENKMKKTSKQDTGFVPRQIQIWKCAKPSESVRSAVKSQQQVLNTVCKKCTACAKCSELGVQIRGWCTFSRLRLTGEFCLRIRIRWRSMVRCTFSRVLIFAGTPALHSCAPIRFSRGAATQGVNRATGSPGVDVNNRFL